MSRTRTHSEGGGVAGAQAISRSVHVLRVVAQLQRSGATAARVALATGLTRPTVFRILRALEAERMVERRDEDQGYWLGPLSYELGLASQPRLTAQARWHAAVAQVATRTRLTSYLIGRSGNEAVCLLCIQGAAAIRAMPVEVGQRVPLGIGAGSLVILASLPDDEVECIMAAHDQADIVFPRGAEPRADLWKRVRRTRAAGYSVSSGTVAKGVSGVGVLVPGSQPQERLAMTLSAVSDSMTPRDAKNLADELARAIGT